MNKNEVIGLLANYLQQAVDFSVAKAPEVLQQFISMQLMINIIMFVIACAVLTFLAVCIIKMAKKREEDRGELFFVSGVFLFVLVLVATLGYKCLAIWLYPEGWLLSYFLTK